MTTEKEPTQEELQKFWEWCGFKYREDMSYSDRLVWKKVWEYPNGTLLDCLPSLTLDNLFRYATVKLPYVALQFCDGIYRASIERYSVSPICISDKPELALFMAIQEAIK